jgi:lipoyl(octanoyl) transferase
LAVEIVDLGVIEYAKALRFQEKALERVLGGAPPVLFLLEHLPVITLGRQGSMEHLLAGREELALRGVDLVRSTRGGDITCHYPGQLVAYPIFRMGRGNGGLRKFFHDLEEVLIRVLGRCGIQGERIQGRTGVFVGGRKIGSIGIGVRRWVSYHGMSLNVGPDLSLFSMMHPCGLKGVEPTAVHLELGRASPPLEKIKEMTADVFQNLFTAA